MTHSFCVFELLGLEDDECRHSRVNGWLLDPTATHGFGDRFLKTWLALVFQEASNATTSPVDAASVEGWKIQSVDVLREWRYIDLLLLLTLEGGARIPICIENKVNATQGENQLARYRERVTSAFPAAANYLFVFLTKRSERPDDPAYLSATYRHVLQTLESCLAASSGAEPTPATEFVRQYGRLLLHNYNYRTLAGFPSSF